MTENSESNAVGADKIDAYIDSVERVLLAASVAKSERLQILEDLELQITEMLGHEILPLTEEKVAEVLSTLEPASHFAAIYGTTSEAPQTQAAAHATDVPHNRWVLVAAAGAALIPLACFLLLFLSAVRAARGPAVLVLFFLLIGIVVTPIALHRGFVQLRAEPRRYRGRDLAIIATTTYAAVVPLLLLMLATVASEGFLLVPIAIASFLYFQWRFIRQVRNRLAAYIPSQPSAESPPPPSWRFSNSVQPAPCG